jgi:hypothetical protein
MSQRALVRTSVAFYILAMLHTLAGFSPSRAHCLANELAKLTAHDAAGGDKFGFAATYSGNTIVVGAIEDENGTGAAYVYVGQGPDWDQQAKLVHPDGQFSDWFGYSVALDGDTLVVGCRADDDLGDNSGSAFVFVRDGTTWMQQAKLLANDGDAVDLFGISVAIDGDTIVVGAIGDDDAAERAGAAYVFVRDGTTWTQQHKFVAADGGRWDEFGTCVAIDGDTAAVGSIGDDDQGDCAGAVYVYTRSGTTWTHHGKLTVADGATSDNFGMSVAIDGDMIVSGAPGDDDMGPTSGSASVFVRSGTAWTQQAKLIAADGVDNAQLGESVSLSGDIAVVGAVNDSTPWGTATGSAYVFVRDGDSWSQAAKLMASDAAFCDNAGGAVCISGDAVVVGAQNNDDAGENSGAAYVFRGLADCNFNGVLDICDIADGTSADDDGDGIPDECDCWGDLDGDGIIGLADLAVLLAHYDVASGMTYADGDLDGDGDVDLADLATLLSVYDTACD